jgi:dihydrofolate reductase
MTTFLSLDGIVQGPGTREEDPSGGFDKGGWLLPLADEDMVTWVNEWFLQADDFLLGRKTYEIFAAHWPNVVDENDPVPTRLNKLPKYVVSTTLTSLEWENSTLITGNVAEEVARLKARPGGELQVHGSGVLARTLMEHDLIDEYRLWYFPVALGTGKRMFEGGSGPKTLRLVDSKTTRTGAMVHTYRPA